MWQFQRDAWRAVGRDAGAVRLGRPGQLGATGADSPAGVRPSRYRYVSSRLPRCGSRLMGVLKIMT